MVNRGGKSQSGVFPLLLSYSAPTYTIDVVKSV